MPSSLRPPGRSRRIPETEFRGRFDGCPWKDVLVVDGTRVTEGGGTSDRGGEEWDQSVSGDVRGTHDGTRDDTGDVRGGVDLPVPRQLSPWYPSDRRGSLSSLTLLLSLRRDVSLPPGPSETKMRPSTLGSGPYYPVSGHPCPLSIRRPRVEGDGTVGSFRRRHEPPWLMGGVGGVFP